MKKTIGIFLSILLFSFNAFARSNTTELIMQGTANGVTAKLYWVPKIFSPVLVVENKGTVPLKLNYLSDEYYYIANGKNYLIITEDGNPPYSEGYKLINPDEQFQLRVFKLESSEKPDQLAIFSNKLENGQITGMLVKLNYGRLEIKLTLVSFCSEIAN